MLMRPVELKSQEQGVGLIEILLTLIILSIGFLSVAQMQIQGLRSNQLSSQGTVAQVLVGDMMDRMRNNPLGLAAGSYDDETTADQELPTCSTTGCTPAQQAAMDLYDWSSNFVDVRDEGTSYIAALPGASGTQPATGTISDPVAGVYTITVTWNGFVDGAAANQSVAFRFIP